MWVRVMVRVMVSVTVMVRVGKVLGLGYNRLPVLQISMFMSSSQDLVAASGQRRPAKPSGALCIMQSTTTCCTDCVMCPQAHVADS